MTNLLVGCSAMSYQVRVTTSWSPCGSSSSCNSLSKPMAHIRRACIRSQSVPGAGSAQHGGMSVHHATWAPHSPRGMANGSRVSSMTRNSSQWYSGSEEDNAAVAAGEQRRGGSRGAQHRHATGRHGARPMQGSKPHAELDPFHSTRDECEVIDHSSDNGSRSQQGDVTAAGAQAATAAVARSHDRPEANHAHAAGKHAPATRRHAASQQGVHDHDTKAARTLRSQQGTSHLLWGRSEQVGMGEVDPEKARMVTHMVEVAVKKFLVSELAVPCLNMSC